MPSGGGGSSGGTSTQVVQQQSVPPFLEDAYRDVAARAAAQSEAPYVPYEGQRIEGFSPEQEQAFANTQSAIGAYNPTLTAGINATNTAATPFNQGIFDQFQNPYQSQVVDEIARLGNRNFSENIMPGVNNTFTGNGMFGSSRNAEILGRAARDVQADITGKQGDYLSQGFQNNMTNYGNAMDRSLSAGNQLGTLATTGQSMTANDINALYGVGAQKQQQGQQLADVAYNEFITQQQYPQTQTAFYSDIVHGISPQGLTRNTTQSYAPAGNPITQALGIGGNLYQANQLLSGTGKAKGGHVKAKKKAMRKSSKPMGIGGMAYA